MKAIENSTPQTDSVKSTSGSINERGIEQLAEAESVTLSAVGWWTAVGSGRANPYYDGWSYGLRCSNQTNASVTMTVALNDTTAPTVTEISYPDVTDDLFPAGAQVPVTVTFSELVQSDGATITANGTVLSAQEAAGTLSKTLTFLYPVEAVDNRTIQVTDTGINPGSGVGNHRHGLNEKSLGVPVISIGIPTVVDAATIVNDTMFNLIAALSQSRAFDMLGNSLEELSDGEKYELIRELLAPNLNAMFVTPKDIDESVKRLSFTISEGINIAFMGGKTLEPAV